MLQWKCVDNFFIVSEKHKEVQLTKYDERIIKYSFNVSDELAKKIFKDMKKCLKKDK